METAWIDMSGRYFAHLTHQFVDGHHLEATFVGEDAEALQALFEPPRE